VERQKKGRFLGGSQASPFRPSNKSSVEMKMLRWILQWLVRGTSEF
jgi:hypothetical protein